MDEKLICELFKKLDKEKLIEVISKYLELTSGGYENILDVNVIKHGAADAIFAIIFSDNIYSECIDFFLEDVESIPYNPIALNIDENFERLLKISKIFGDTHEWSCNDNVKILYTNLVCAMLLNSPDVNLKINEFIANVFDIDI